jgi:hypothetical protein
MTVVAPPPHDDPELLIREARARQRKRRLGAAAVLVALTGVALATLSIVVGTAPKTSTGDVPAISGAASARRCGVRVAGTRILAGDGSVVYRDPSPSAMRHEVQCTGPTVWVLFVNGVGMMHEEYVGVRSPDRGKTWRVAFAQSPGVHARYGDDAEPGPWTLVGRRAAYFVGSCPACEGYGTLSLSVTRDAGRTFRSYPVPGSDLWAPWSIRVSGRRVTIRERRNRGLHRRWRTVTLHVA